jgi:hypothetical protein
MPRKLSFLGIFALLTIFTIGFAACGDDTVNGSSGPQNQPELPNTNQVPRGAQRAEPVAASNNPSRPVVLDSFNEGDKNWYIIDAGYIRNTFVAQMGPTHYPGFGSITVSRRESVESSFTRSTRDTVSDSIVVTEGTANTRSLQEAITAGITVGGGIPEIFKVETSLAASLTRSFESTRSFETARGKSRETSQEFIQSLTVKTETEESFTLDRSVQIGYYRFAWYTVSDIYFIISTSLDNQRLLSWEVISCARADPTSYLEYSPDNRFDNTPTGNLITFAEDFWKTLQIPAGPSYELVTTANPTAGGRVDRNPNATRYNAGTRVSVTAIPNSGYEFVNWTGTGAPAGAAANSLNINVTMNSNLTLNANFRPISLTLTVVPSPSAGGTVTPTTRSNITPGTAVSITAIPASGYTWGGWTVVQGTANILNDNPATTVTLSTDATIRANFAPAQAMLTVERYPTPFGNTNPTAGTSTHPANTPIPITASAASGNRFIGWTVMEGTARFGNPGSANTTVTLSTDARIRANFLPTNANFQGEVGRLSLRNSTAAVLHFHISYLRDNGVWDRVRAATSPNDILVGQTRTVDPGASGIPDGSVVRVYSDVRGGIGGAANKEAAEHFIYRAGNPRTASYTHTGTTLGNTLTFNGAN